MTEKQELLNCTLTINYLKKCRENKVPTETDTFIAREIHRLEKRKQEILCSIIWEKEKI